ncbi:hypothetical protein O6H91_22G039200 [Diphasiastrum complanatum]|uniref:Uncharacterized protein n=2 Tax=Diphasiastrum complanatum TaxID=34168 RepID=A0ACC2AEN0_DIPCM|nr:hypothetical protein O6H91_22G039200 [Diphasiastrum complanatum]KAJ7516027.1 hypothetical protein O6H91_22G039200 [Diphasiastrum complanatum]
MRTRGVKKSPVPRRGAKTPTKGLEAETVASVLGVLKSEDVQSPGVDVQEDARDLSDGEITLAIDLESESTDTNIRIITVGANGASAGSYKEVSENGNDVSVGLSNVALEGSFAEDKTVKFDEDTPEMPKKTEAVNATDDHGDVDFEIDDEVEDIEQESLQIDDEVEDEVEDEDENDGEVDADEDFEIENFKDHVEGHAVARGNEKFADQTSLVMHYSKPISERRKQKRVEVFVGGLDKEATEEELRAVFEKVGKVTEIRLLRNAKTGKTKGHAFVRYADYLEARKAVYELNDTEVHGRPCRVSPSEENDILYLGNIRKDWKKENVMETLRKYDIESVENVTLIEDPENEKCHQGFGFLEFTTHSDALKAFKRLQKPDAVFGSERSAQVAWVEHSDEPDEVIMFQVKSVFVDGMPAIWDEQRAKELFGKYGEIEQVNMGRKRLTSKRKKFGFIKYATREDALACIEAVNNSEIIEGDEKIMLKARLAKPAVKRRGVKKGIHGDFPTGQDIGGEGGGVAASKAGEPKGRVRKRTGKSRSRNERKGQKAKTVKTQALYIGDQANKFHTSSLEQRLLQGGRSDGSPHQNNKHNRHKSVVNPSIPGNGVGGGNVHPRKKSIQYKRTLFRQNSVAAADEEAYAHNPGRAGVRNFDLDRYRDSVRGYREARGRKRDHSDLEDDVRYADIPQGGHARVRLTHPHPETIPFAVPHSQVPAGHVAHYAVVQGFTSTPETVIQRPPPYAIYGPSATPVYAAGGYSYTEVSRSGTYISSAYGGYPHSLTGNMHHSVSAANFSRYY